MSNLSVHIKTPPYLGQWLHHEYWNPESKRLEFPRGSAPRVILQTLLTKTPPGQLPHIAGEDEIAVEVPTFKGVNPATFCHLPEAGKKALVSCLKKCFQSVMWQELHPLLSLDVQISEVIYALLDRHGIEGTEQNWETVRQMYYRMRKKTANRECVKDS